MTPPTEWPVDRYINRELSWLDFNERVLELGANPDLPVLERAKFLAIFASNLDEFYMVRVAGLQRQREAGVGSRSIDGLTAAEQLTSISAKVVPLVERHSEVFEEDLMPRLSKAGIDIVRWKELDEGHCKELEGIFTESIFPVVTPLAVDPGHPFPYISNLSLNLAVTVRDPGDERTRFARVKVPPILGRFIALSDGVFVPIEDVIAANLAKLFSGMEIVEHYSFRVTRNADLDIDDDGAEDLLQALEEELAQRRFSPAVRLEIEAGTPLHVLDLLIRELQVDEADVHELGGPLDLAGLWDLYALDRPDLKDEPFLPQTHPVLQSSDDAPKDIFEVIADQDILVHHPYESFTTSVQRFIEQASTDPDVLAIKQTLYRTSGESPIVNALMEAARAGKQVVVLVEIKARFDELANIGWARTLERAGCHVVYGVVGLKTHCKLCLVVRREGSGLKRYVHVGTGNYNPRTARIYEDLGLLTSDEDLGADVSDLFNYLTGYARQSGFRSLVVAPYGLREQIIAMIEREATLGTPDEPGRIVMKLNGLVDEAITDALYAASQEGVQIDLIVRGICSLRPGVPGLSDNITVRSILGRFLEHSRILYFKNGGNDELYIGSADLMHRNLDRRVEAMARVGSTAIKTELRWLLQVALSDNYSAWSLDADGRWTRIVPGEDEEVLSLQHRLVTRAMKHA